MESCLGELHLQYYIIYLDDIIIFSKTPEEHLHRLKLVFQKIWEAGLKLKPSKCEFFRTKLEYLGHIVSEKGIETKPKKIQVIWDWPHLTNITETCSFLGLCNYYRKFIKDYAKIAQPLYKLISGENSKGKRNEVEWDQDCEIAFLLLKRLCTEAPIIGPIVELLKTKQLQQYKAKEDDPSGMRVLLKYQQDLCLRNGLVYQKVQLKNHQLSVQQFVLPEPFQKQVILACHDDFGHLGMEKTLGLLKDRFFWPKMSEDIKLHIHSCERCTKFKQPQE